MVGRLFVKLDKTPLLILKFVKKGFTFHRLAKKHLLLHKFRENVPIIWEIYQKNDFLLILKQNTK